MAKFLIQDNTGRVVSCDWDDKTGTGKKTVVDAKGKQLAARAYTNKLDYENDLKQTASLLHVKPIE